MNTISEYPIETVLESIESAYERDMKHHTARMIMNVFQCFGIAVPPIEKRSLQETLGLLYKKYNE
jgi:hypothetical protein